jgi:uncharacterized protein YndB with AHSA1/START domain
VIERVYGAPVDRVYDAWAVPGHKARWFTGSADALDAGYELDFRVGGREVNRGGPRGGPVYTYDARFCDIVPGQRIVYTYEMYAGDDRISVSVMRRRQPGRRGSGRGGAPTPAPGPSGGPVDLAGAVCHCGCPQPDGGTGSPRSWRTPPTDTQETR